MIVIVSVSIDTGVADTIEMETIIASRNKRETGIGTETGRGTETEIGRGRGRPE